MLLMPFGSTIFAFMATSSVDHDGTSFAPHGQPDALHDKMQNRCPPSGVRMLNDRLFENVVSVQEQHWSTDLFAGRVISHSSELWEKQQCAAEVLVVRKATTKDAECLEGSVEAKSLKSAKRRRSKKS